MTDREANDPRGGLLRAAIGRATRRPRLIVAVWGFAIVLMAIAGLGAKDVLKPEDLLIRGTQSADAVKFETKNFGKTTPLIIQLQGPDEVLDQVGPPAVAAIEKFKGASVSSPWSPGAPKLLKDSADRALLIVTIDKTPHVAGRDVVPKIRERLAEILPPGVQAEYAGESRFGTELVDQVFSGATKAEIAAIPFLLLILLLIFRAPIAAMIPLTQGLAVIIVTTGFVTLLGRVIDVNVLAQASGSIIGLALGVDYSLLFVSRFRDELSAGATVEQAVAHSLETAGRTVAFAGGILALAGIFVIAVTFGWASMTTGSIGVIMAAVFAVVAAFTLLPASLMLIGENINRWPIGRVRSSSALTPLVTRLISKPLAASIAVLIPLLLLCASGLATVTGGPDLKVFDKDNEMRVDVEAIADHYGGGVLSPYAVFVKSKQGPVTSPRDVRAMQNFQRRLAADPAVKYVVGPGTTRVRRAADTAEGGPATLAKFDYGLGAASTGVRDLRKGLGEGAKSANQLASGNGTALAGARQLQNGFAAAAGGAGALGSGLNKSASGSQQLDSALGDLAAGARKLRDGTREANRQAADIAESAAGLKSLLDSTNNELESINQPNSNAIAALSAAQASLDAMPPAMQADPDYQSAYQSVQNAQSELNSAGSLSGVISKYNSIATAFGQGVDQARSAASGASKLSSGAGRLASGLSRAQQGTGSLSSGLNQLSAGTSRLNSGLAPLLGGAAALTSGLGQLQAGSGQLGAGLSSGQKNSKGLETGLKKLKGKVAETRDPAAAPIDIKRVARSAYLTMAMLSAAPAEDKKNLRLVLNEPRGGSAARIYLFTDRFPTDKTMTAFAARLEKQSLALGKQMDATVAVGGQGQSFLDYDRFTHSRIWPLIAVLSLMSFLFLLVVFRSPLLAAKAVILNMLTVGAAIGVINLLYGGGEPLLGGPGWLEATSFFVVYTTTFALSMDYEIFIINRMRESYLQTGSNEQAIRDGVAKTTGIVTGSAAVMIVLFLAMAFFSDLVSNAQMGLGLAVAIAIDATVVRLILLPASMRLFGDANWWLPPWLDRILPDIAIHSASRDPQTVDEAVSAELIPQTASAD